MLEGKSMIKIILIFALLSGSAYASTEKFKITFTATEDGGGMVYEIDTSTVSNLPEWNPDKEEPPLSIKDAVSIGWGPHGRASLFRAGSASCKMQPGVLPAG